MLGNLVGTDATGASGVPNGGSGVVIANAATNNTLGGATTGQGNTIAFNAQDGVVLTGADNNAILFNTITSNLMDGVSLSSSNGNQVTSNTITSNALDGVAVITGTGNAILSNSIFASGGLGIRLVTGGNNSQPAPSLDEITAGGTTLVGSLDAAASTSYTVQFFSSHALNASGFGEGQTLIGSQTVTTDSTGHADFGFAVPAGVAINQFITATATDPNNNTSQFSNGVQVTTIPINNGINPNTAGSFAFAVGTAGDSRDAQISANGTTGLLQSVSALFQYYNYVQVGGTGGATNLASTTITTPPTLVSPGVVISQGTFAGPNGPVTWTVTTQLGQGSEQLTNTVQFSSQGPLGNINYINYLDEDLFAVGDDVLYPVGVPGSPGFQVFTLDGPHAHRLQPVRRLRPLRPRPGQRDLERVGRRQFPQPAVRDREHRHLVHHPGRDQHDRPPPLPRPVPRPALRAGRRHLGVRVGPELERHLGEGHHVPDPPARLDPDPRPARGPLGDRHRHPRHVGGELEPVDLHVHRHEQRPRSGRQRDPHRPPANGRDLRLGHRQRHAGQRHAHHPPGQPRPRGQVGGHDRGRAQYDGAGLEHGHGLQQPARPQPGQQQRHGRRRQHAQLHRHEHEQQWARVALPGHHRRQQRRQLGGRHDHVPDRGRRADHPARTPSCRRCCTG